MTAMEDVNVTDVSTLPIDDVRFVKELYPRLREDDAAIERYRDAIDNLPPIVTARGGVLVDGFHRWQAHKREARKTIDAEDLGDLSDAEILRQSYRRNARHGQQMSKADKIRAAEHMYRNLGGTEDERYAEIAEVLSIVLPVAKKYAAAARADEQRIKQAQAWDMWLDCAMTQREIGEKLGESQQTINNWVQKRERDSRFCTPPGATSDNPWGRVQHFDVWTFRTADDDPDGDDDTAGTGSYFGKMPPQVVENVLWFWTEPGDIAVDPFVGGGTTIDVAKRMGRRVWASDRKPSTPTLPIHEHDILDGWPDGAPKKAKLIFLDPPYWQQAAGKYSDDPADLGNMTYDEFMASWHSVVKTCMDHIDDGGRMAFIISPTQLDDGTVIDHATEMTEVCVGEGLTVDRRIIVPYNTQQATGQQVTWARENKRLLKLYRDLVVLRP
jgi:adenine-specific DNA-methyltransferase